VASEEVAEELASLLAATVMSGGTIKGLLPAAPRLTPLEVMTSGLAAKKVRVYLERHRLVNPEKGNRRMGYMVFSATYLYDHSGKLLMSMLPPQVAAYWLPEVWELV
jgi:hypothetical protein